MRLIICFLLLLSTHLMAEDFTYSFKKQNYEGFFLKGKKANAPLVFIIHDWDGIDAYEKKRAEMLFALGYNVFAIDLFGKGIRPEKTEDRMKITGELYQNREKMRELMNAGLAEAQKLGLNINNAAVTGYCFGGTAALEWAKSGVNLKGIISFHGGLAPGKGDSYKNTKGKIMIFHGSADQSVSLQDFADLGQLLEKEQVPHEMITYSGAPHAFTKFDSDRYRKDADEKSWARFTGFLQERLTL